MSIETNLLSTLATRAIGPRRVLIDYHISRSLFHWLLVKYLGGISIGHIVVFALFLFLCTLSVSELNSQIYCYCCPVGLSCGVLGKPCLCRGDWL